MGYPYWQKALLGLGLAGLMVGVGSRAQAFFSYLIHGHEYLTLFALEQLQRSEDPLMQVFYGQPLGAVSYRAHPLFYGNAVVDYPELDRDLALDLLAIAKGEGWAALTAAEQEQRFTGMVNHSDHQSQMMQFTRNYLGDNRQSVVSAKVACSLSHQFIRDVVLHGTRAIAGLTEETAGLDRYERKQIGLQFIGAALHTLQDAFSLAHTERDRQTLTIQDVCTFQYPYFGRNGESRYSVGCVHTIWANQPNFGGGSVVVDDEIWDRTQSTCTLAADGSTSKDFGCLKDEAQLATVTTRDFLAMLVPFLDEALRRGVVQEETLAIALEQFLTQYHPQRQEPDTQGILSCASLSDFTPHTRLDSP